jgi:hypothetical protein
MWGNGCRWRTRCLWLIAKGIAASADEQAKEREQKAQA